MDAIDRIITSARRRLFVQATLDTMAYMFLWAIGICASVLLIERLAAIEVVKWLYPGVALAAIMLAPLTVARRMPARDRIAAMIDDRMKLKDRISTGLYAGQLADHPFAHQVVAEARQAAMGVNVSTGFPVRLSPAWAHVGMTAVVFAMLAVFTPSLDMLGIRERSQRALQAQQTKEQVAEVVAVAEKIEREQRTFENEADKLESISELDSLAKMTTEELTDPQTRREAASKLSSIEEKIADAANRAESEVETMRNAMSRLDAKTPGPADPFLDAMRRGDFEEAEQQVNDLAEAVQNMSEEDRQKLAEQMQNLAAQLEQIAQEQAQRSEDAQQQTEQTLRDAGLSQQQIDQLTAQQFDPQAVQKQLQEQGKTAQQSEQIARKVSQQQQQKKSAGECSQCAGGMSQTMSSPSQQANNGKQSPRSGTPKETPSASQQHPSNGMQQALKQTGEQVSQMAAKQQQAGSLRQSQSQARQAMQQLSQNPQSNPRGPQATGPRAGRGSAPLNLSESAQPQAQRTHVERQSTPWQGRSISSWTQQGQTEKGDPQVGFDNAVSEAAKTAEQAVTEDRVPRRYHPTVQQYFNRLPEAAKKAE